MPSVHETVQKYTIGDGLRIVPDLKESHGSWVVDAESRRRYLDCFSMHASQPLGWNHPSYVEKSEPVSFAAHYNPTNSDLYCKLYTDFLDSISDITPDFKKYFFVAGGGLAVDNALKASFDWKARKLGRTKEECCNDLDIIHLSQAFHGRSGYALSLTNTGINKVKFFPRWPWTRIINPHVHGEEVEEREKTALEQAERALCGGKVAAIILEPIQGEGGDNHFRREFFQGLRVLADRHDALLIFDEVQTGVGMTGRLWCYEHFGVRPDLLVFGKKTQVCGFCSNSRINEVSNNVFVESGRINSTWGGNLVDMVRAQVYFEVIREENLVRNAANVGYYLLEKLRNVPGLQNVRGRGLMIAFDLEGPQAREEAFGRLSSKMLCLRSGERAIRLRPPLTFSEEDADMAVKFISQAV